MLGGGGGSVLQWGPEGGGGTGRGFGIGMHLATVDVKGE